ncbi:hypothetical protein DFH27DRAFT_637422, partial [Peziza echinospora]
QLSRPAFGHHAKLGDLYDAHTGTFLPQSIFSCPIPKSALQSIDLTKNIPPEYIETDTYKEKLTKLGFDIDLQECFLAGLFTPTVMGNYLNKYRSSNSIQEMSMILKRNTVHQSLNLMSPALRREDMFALEGAEELSGATHVVTEILWGATTVVTADLMLDDVEMGISTETSASNILRESLENLLENKVVGDIGHITALHQKVNFQIHGDFIPVGLELNYTIEAATEFLNKLLPKYIAAENRGNGMPVSYILMPLPFLKVILDIGSPDGESVQLMRPRVGAIERIIQLFDEFRVTRRALTDYHSLIMQYTNCVPLAHTQDIGDLIARLDALEVRFKLAHTKCMKRIRMVHSGGEARREKPADHQGIFDAYQIPAEFLITVAGKYAGKIDFVRAFVGKGAHYVGFPIPGGADITAPQKDVDVYIFYFHWDAHHTLPEFVENCNLLFELLREGSEFISCRTDITLIDCDACGSGPFSKPYILHKRNDGVATENLLEDYREQSTLAMMKYSKLDPAYGIRQRPINMAKVTLKCPGLNCELGDPHNWICFKCRNQVSFCFDDKCLYCECGRSVYSNWSFHCPGEGHGKEWAVYKGELLLRSLQGLKPFDTLNILILGETGVGKSTFINAFVNYLTFDSLDEAVEAKKFKCIIPFSFATQVVNEDSPQRTFTQTMIRAGSDKNEKDGSQGQSATQGTIVHNIQIGPHTVRLFDTPGIGDTRGASKDTENMANILSVLANYPTIHGILILLKPNNARLTIMFRFCIKELLTHLHRDAARNMVFGFTNTRGSNYTPGDTFEPLKIELGTMKGADIPLCEDTVYCFDSESFRYLAAHHQGVNLGNQADYSLSWNQSSRESHRLLNYFRTLAPHNVKSTISLNDTRHMITQLTKPMAEIVRTIDATIKVNQEHIQSLSQDELKRSDLMKQLHVKMATLEAHTLDMPRTVCSNETCIEYKDDGSNSTKPNLQVIYKQLCHNPCYLRNIPTDTISHAGLIQCAAFSGQQNCQHCKHIWQQHLHILYELRPGHVLKKSPEIEERLATARSDIERKGLLIRDKESFIRVVRSELHAIEQASVQFCLFLKKNSITPYNDATLEYLAFLIKDERGKVSAGGNSDKLDSLEAYRDQYREQVRILTAQIDSGDKSELLDSQGVHNVVKKLYSLKYYGNQLKQIKSVIARAHDGTFREEAHHV